MSQLTSLNLAGCENVTDTFFLNCFASDLNSLPVSSVHDPPHVASSHMNLSSLNVASKESICRRWSCCNAFGDTCSRQFCPSVGLGCVWNCSSHQNADKPLLMPTSAGRDLCHDTVAPVVVEDYRQASCNLAVNFGRVNQSADECCDTKTKDNHISVSYRLERLDMSGCWRITDLSIRWIFASFCASFAVIQFFSNT